MNAALQSLMKTCIAIGTAETLVTLGVSSGEISQRKALKVYGKLFSSYVNAGRIRPSRIEEGRTGTRWYRITDILTQKAIDAATAELR